MKKPLIKYRMPAAVIADNVMLLIVRPQTEMTVLRFTGRNFLNFLFMLTPIFIGIGLMDVWVGRDVMIKVMGVKSGMKGVLLALLLGVVILISVKKGDKIVAQNAFFSKRIAPFYLLFNGILV